MSLPLDTIDALFGPTGHVTWSQECARAIVVFAYGLVLVRLAGRRVFGKWSALAVIEAAPRTALVFIRYARPAEAAASHEAKKDVRLGRWLALALEFELGADILRTAVAPTWSEIGQLAAIATIRTLLNDVLQQEIDKAAVRRDGADAAEAPDLSSRSRG